MGADDQNNTNKTQAYSQDRETHTTQRYEENGAKTKAYEQEHVDSSLTTKPYEPEEQILGTKTETHGLGAGDTITLNENDYTITDIISGDSDTAEAVIYKIKNASGDMLVLKLYRSFADPRHEPNPEALERIRSITDPDILKLHDYGTGIQKYQDKFCFEISDFAEGGNLLQVPDIRQKYTPEFLEKHVVPEILKGIKRLHQNRIYHCDLKPQNVFYLNENQTDLVIGDYGSAKTFEHDSEKCLKRTAIVKGTEFYLAPEQARGIVSAKNDYYSLGMIILHLLYPDHANQNNLDKIIERQLNKKMIINFDPAYERFNNLITGLTFFSYELRWGEEEIERWLAGEDVLIATERVSGPGIKIDEKREIKTISELIEYYKTDESWYTKLIEDTIGFQQLLEFLSHASGLGKKQTFEQMVRYYQQDGEPFVREAVQRFFEPQRPIAIEYTSYDLFNSTNLNNTLTEFFEHFDAIFKITDLDTLKLYLFQLEFSLRSLEIVAKDNLRMVIKAALEKIASALNRPTEEGFEDLQAVMYPHLTLESCIELLYAFNEDRGFKDLSNQSYKTKEEVGLFFAKEEDLFDDYYVMAEKKVFLRKTHLDSLENLSYNDFLLMLFDEHVQSQLTFVSLSLNSPEKNQCRIDFRIGKSLTAFLQKNAIQKDLTFINPEDQTIIIDKPRLSDCHYAYRRFLSALEVQHHVKDRNVEKRSRTEFKQQLCHQFRLQQREISKTRVSNIFQFINIPFLVKSLSFLFPFFILHLLTAAAILSDQEAISLLKRIPLLQFNIGPPRTISSFYVANAAAINILIFISLVPALIFTFSSQKMRMSKRVLKTLIGILVLMTIGYITNLKVQHQVLQDFIRYAGILVGIIGAVMLLVWLLRLLSVFAIVLPIGPLLITEPRIRSSFPSETYEHFVLGYILLMITLLLIYIIRFYWLQKPFRVFPFFISILLFATIDATVLDIGRIPGINLSSVIPERSSEKSYAVINVPAVNVRSSPSSEASILGTVLKGQKFKILGEEGGWYRIQYNDAHGYIFGKLVDINNDN